MKRILLSALCVAGLLGQVPVAQAKETPGAPADGLKPVAVLSIAGYDRVMSDVGFIGQLVQQPGLDKQAEAMITLFTQGQGLNGLDRKRPWGAVVNTDGATFPVLAFLPVSNTKQLLASLAALTGPATEAANGIYELEKNNQKVYVKEQTGWAFLAQTPEVLSNLPADPSKLLRGLDKQYEVALQFHLQNVPEMFRSMAVDQLRMGVQGGLRQQPNEDEATFELRQKMIQNQVKALEDLINETDQVTVGWALDQKTAATALDITVTALSGSNMAKKLTYVKDGASAYAGFVVPKSAVSLNIIGTISKEDAEQSASALDTLKASVSAEIEKSDDMPDENTKTAAKEILGEVLDALKDTILSGKMDGAGSLLLGPKSLSLVAGCYITQPAELEKALKRLSQVTVNDPNVPKIKFNADKHADVRFHTMQIPVPQGEKVAKVLGSTLDLAVGFGTNSVYLALGTDALGTLKKAIDKSKVDAAKKLPPGMLDIALQPIMEFAGAVDDNPINQMLAAELAKAGGKDHIQLIVKPISGGVTYHIEAQQGVLKLVGAAGKMRSGGPPVGGGFGPPGGAGPPNGAVPPNNPRPKRQPVR